MSETRVNITLSFSSRRLPADLAVAVATAVVANIPDDLDGLNWHAFEVDEADGECAHTSWEQTAFTLGDGTPVASRKCADCKEQLPTILLEERRADA